MQQDLPKEGGQIYQNQNSNGMIEGLREAQEELEGLNQYDTEGDNNVPLPGGDENVTEQPSFLPTQVQGDIEFQLEHYLDRIQEEKSRLEEAKAFIEESKDKIDKRLERIRQLEESVKKMKENMRVIDTELQVSKEFHDEFSKQIKEKLGIKQSEQRGEDS